LQFAPPALALCLSHTQLAYLLTPQAACAPNPKTLCTRRALGCAVVFWAENTPTDGV